MNNTILHYVGLFIKELVEQLTEDHKEYGNDWEERPVDGQVERIYAILLGYLNNFRQSGEPVPWLKVAGLALIGWAREYRERL